MHEKRVTYVQAAHRSGLSRESLTAWRVRNIPDVTSLEAVLGVLGLRLEVVDAETGRRFEPRPETMANLGATLAERETCRARFLERRAARRAAQAGASMLRHNGGPPLMPEPKA
ncbi:hypothetical protein CR165_23445 [Pseudoroseomonas aestuarii]|uniref:Uncharacterized protein n=2 Tax=Teichococcus aestuarii TaxID=568898 RepID=A0A2U1UXP2_9PROT|nr:hypothetical protein CR165_23445 [Pseudoroseomonas aestuarii]